MAVTMTADPERQGIDAEINDAELIELIASGEAHALETLYDRYSRVVFSFAVRILSDAQVA